VLTVKKLGHFVLFALLAWLAFSSVAHRREPVTTLVLTTTGAALLLFAAAAEVIQFLSTTRTPSFTDWMLDSAGIVIGGSLALIWSRMGNFRPPGRTDAKVGEQLP
jgi:VanZ family protein